MIVLSQILKFKIIITILIVILCQGRAEVLQSKIKSSDVNEDLVEMKDFKKLSLAFAELAKDCTRNSELKEVKDELNDLKKQIADEPDLDEIVEKLKQLSKIGTLRSCEEYAAFGIQTSGLFPIDPDGTLVGEPPFSAFCRFDHNTG